MDDSVDCLSVDNWRDGDWKDVVLRVPIECMIKEMDTLEYNFGKFPKGFVKDRPNPSGKLIGETEIDLWPPDWFTENDEEVENTFELLANSIETLAIPWFDSINSREALIDSIKPRLRDGDAGENWKRRLLDNPLAIMIQSTSAAGKSTLMESILSFIPSEHKVIFSAMTGQSLFYMGQQNIKHKILAIAEEEGVKLVKFMNRDYDGEVTTEWFSQD